MSDESENPWDAFGAYLRSQRQLAQLSLRQLSALTQVSNPYLSQIERGLHQPSIAIIKALAEALNLSVNDLLAHAADTASGGEAPTNTQRAIRNDPKLSDSQKSALLAVYVAMANEDPEQESPTAGPTRRSAQHRSARNGPPDSRAQDLPADE